LHGDVDAADHENVFLCFHLPRNLSDELAVTRIDVTRFQRAPKSAEHSTTGRCYHVINRGSVGFREFGRIYLVVLRNCTVDAEADQQSERLARPEPLHILSRDRPWC
jgi:hypothetical protein